MTSLSAPVPFNALRRSSWRPRHFVGVLGISAASFLVFMVSRTYFDRERKIERTDVVKPLSRSTRRVGDEPSIRTASSDVAKKSIDRTKSSLIIPVVKHSDTKTPASRETPSDVAKKPIDRPKSSLITQEVKHSDTKTPATNDIESRVEEDRRKEAMERVRHIMIISRLREKHDEALAEYTKAIDLCKDYYVLYLYRGDFFSGIMNTTRQSPIIRC